MQDKNPNKMVHKKNNIILRIILFLVVLFIGIFFALNSPVFNVEEIKINNNQIIHKKDILKASKINRGTNIFKLNSKLVENELLKNPFLKSVSINRKLPSSINIDVVERKKAFSLQSASIYLLVDEEGFIMDHLDSRDKKLTNIKGFNIKSNKIGENIFSTEENTSLKLFIDEAEKLNLFVQIDEIDKNFANDINLKFKNKISVAFGPLSNVKYKLSLLKEILEDINKKEIKSGQIIMNEGDHPFLIIDE